MNTDAVAHGFVHLPPLSRQQWDSLGYHIYTNDAETLTNVVSYSREIDLPLPCSSVEEIASAFGVEGTPIHALEGSARHLSFRSLTILDPEKAKSVFPFAALMEPGNRIRRAVRDEKWYVRTSDWDALESIPGDLSIRWNNGDALIVLFSIRDIKINGSRPLPILHRDSSGEDTPHLVVTESLLETMLLSARKAAARYMIPEAVNPYSVALNGVVQGDRYYLLSDLAGVPPAPNKRAAFKSRSERLTAQFGDFLPENWSKLSDEEVVEHADWKRHRVNEGWLTSWDLAQKLDIANSVDLGSWLVAINWPSLPHPVSGEDQRLFAPITWDEVISHEAFADLFAAVIGTHQSFVQRTMFDESARAKVFSRVLAA